MVKQTLNGYVIDLLGETYQKVSLEKTVGTVFLVKSTKGLKPVTSSCSFFGLYSTTEK